MRFAPFFNTTLADKTVLQEERRPKCQERRALLLNKHSFLMGETEFGCN